MLSRSSTTLDASAKTHQRKRLDRNVRPIAVLGSIGVLVAASSAALLLVRHQGIIIGGDEPYYLVEAVSIGRFHTVNLNPGFTYAVVHHIIYPWKATPGPHLAAQIGQRAPHFKDGLVLPTHAIGLSALLAIPMLFNIHVAVAALIVILAVLAASLSYLVSMLAESRSSWTLAISGLFLAPTYLLATTQIYPDLISGLIIGIIVMLIALIERRKRITSLQVAAGAAALALLPWMDAKDILLPIPILVALVIVHFRTGQSNKQLAGLTILPIISLVCVVSFNIWGFSSPFGASQPISLFGLDTLTRTIGLLFDRRQGLLIQLPIVLLGFAGIWISRRRNPLAGLTAIFLIVAFAYGNATEEISFGGTALLGRFEWPDIALLLAFAGLYLLELWKIRSRYVVTIATVCAAIYVYQAIPLAFGEHFYFNRLPWDPSRYASWWGGLDPSPILGYIGSTVRLPTFLSDVLKQNGSSYGGSSIFGSIPPVDWWRSVRTWWGIGFVTLSSATVAYLLVSLLKRPSRFTVSVLCSLIAASVVSGVLALSTPIPLPETVTFKASSFVSRLPIVGTSRIATGNGDRGTILSGPFWMLLPGRYEAVVSYSMLDGAPNAATMTAFAVRGRSKRGEVALRSTTLRQLSRSAEVEFVLVRPEILDVQIDWEGAGRIRVDSVRLTKS